MSITTGYPEFADAMNNNYITYNGVMLEKGENNTVVARGLAGAQPTVNYSLEEAQKIVDNYKKNLTGLPFNWMASGTDGVSAIADASDQSSVGGAGGVSNLSNAGGLTGTQGQSGSAGLANAGGLSGATVLPALGNKLEFDAWKSQYGVDTEKGFQDSVSRLDYEMKTWAANYGANAERLARMGLSNSGMVDIYGTGVVQAYLQSMNDLYLAKAEGDRQNAEAYKKYSDEYEADLAARTATKNNNILAAYNYGLGIYDGSNLEAVTTMIRNAGYDDDVITEAVARLGAVDPSMLPALQTQLAQEQTDINSAIKQMMEAGFDGSYESIMKFKNFYQSQGWSNAKIKKLIEGAKALYAIEPKSDKVKEMYAQIISSESGYKSSMDGQLSQMLSVAEGWSEEEINELLGYLHDFEAAGQSGASDQALIDGVNAVNQMLAKANVAYDGSEELKTQIKQQLRNGEYAEIADQILERMDADLREIKGAAALDEIADIEKTDVKSLTVSGIETDIENAATKYGVDSEAYKSVVEKYEGQLSQIMEGAFENPDKAMNTLGVESDTVIAVANDNEITWGEASTEQKMFYLVDRLGDLYESGAMSEKTYVGLMSDYIKKDVVQYSNSINDCVDAVEYVLDQSVPYEVKQSLVDVVATNAKLQSTYIYNPEMVDADGKVKRATTISIEQKDKKGHINLVVNKATEAEDAQVRKVIKDGQDIYYVGNDVYVIHHTANGDEIYKVDGNATRNYTKRTPMSKENRQGEIKSQVAAYELVLRYAYTHQ